MVKRTLRKKHTTRKNKTVKHIATRKTHALPKLKVVNNPPSSYKLLYDFPYLPNIHNISHLMKNDTLVKLNKDVRNELSENGIYLFIVELPQSNNGYFMIDYPIDIAFSHFELGDEKPFMVVPVKTDNKKKLIKVDALYISHYGLKPSVVDKIMKKHFGQKYKWNGKATRNIEIKL